MPTENSLEKQHEAGQNIIETVAVDRLDLEILKKESEAYRLVVQIQRAEQTLASIQSEINGLYQMRETRSPAAVAQTEQTEDAKSAKA